MCNSLLLTKCQRVFFLFLVFILSSLLLSHPAERPRARDLGIPFDGKTGPFNSITDVKGVEVGHVTLISGEGALEVGKGAGSNGSDGHLAAWQKI